MDKRVDLNHWKIKYAFSLGVDFDNKLDGTVLKEFKCSHPPLPDVSEWVVQYDRCNSRHYTNHDRLKDHKKDYMFINKLDCNFSSEKRKESSISILGVHEAGRERMVNLSAVREENSGWKWCRMSDWPTLTCLTCPSTKRVARETTNNHNQTTNTQILF